MVRIKFKEREMNKKYICYIGNVMSFVGIFLPIVKYEGIGSISMFTNANTTIIAGVIGFLSLYCGLKILIGNYKMARRCAFGTVVGVLVMLFDSWKHLEHGMGIVGINSDYGLTWGWIFLVIGSVIAVSMTTSLYAEEEDKK